MNTRSSLLLCAILSLVSFRALALDQSSAAGGAPPAIHTDDSAEPSSPGDAGASTVPGPASPATAEKTGSSNGVDAPAATPAPSVAQPEASSQSEKSSGKEGKARKKKKKDKEVAQAQEAAEQANGDDDSDEREETLDGDGNGYGSTGTVGRFRMMVQLRYKHSYVDPNKLSPVLEISHQQRATVQEQDGYDIQRAFLRYTARPIKQVEAKILMDFAELRHDNVSQSFKLAYLQIHATKRLEFDIGLMKRTYSLLELLPIVDHELADLGPTDSFIKDQGYGGRDIGAIVRYRPLPKQSWLMASVGAFRGNLDEGYDANPLKLMTARLEGFPWKHLRLGVNGAWRPYDNGKMKKLEDADGEKYYAEVKTMNPGKAMGVDATLLFKRLQVRAEGLYGERTDPGRTSNRFAAGWIVVAPSFKVGQVKFVPAAKFERLDLDLTGPRGGRTILAGVFGVVPVKNLRLLVDITRTIVDDLTPAMSNVPWTSGNDSVTVNEPSSTAGTLQVQYQF